MSGGKQARRLYTIWLGMKDRCSNHNADNWDLYGGRGISVCDQWIHNYEAFRDWSLANGYSDRFVIDRYPDQNGNYEPGNVRWTTPRENNRNMRSNVRVTAFGETKCAMDWANDNRCVVSHSMLCKRINNGMEPEAAITTRIRKNKRARKYSS